MNYLRDLALDSFVLIRAGWTVEKALQLLTCFPKATHVIVYRTEPDIYQHLREESGTTGTAPIPAEAVSEYYYLYTVPEARNLFGQAAPGDPVKSPGPSRRQGHRRGRCLL